MTTFLLIRHASYDCLGRILGGRTPGLHLNPQGEQEAALLAQRLAGDRVLGPIHAVYSSPLERAQETAWPLANRLSVPLGGSEALNELDFGRWAGRPFADLDPLPKWQHWNAARAEARTDGGESMAEAQARIVGEMARLRDLHPEQTVALVSHADTIKAAILHILEMSLNEYWRLEISPASVSILNDDGEGPRLITVNACYTSS